eukprot:sb/3476768/
MFGYRLAFQCDREQLNWTTTRDTVTCFLKLVRSCDRHRIFECSHSCSVYESVQVVENNVSRPLIGYVYQYRVMRYEERGQLSKNYRSHDQSALSSLIVFFAADGFIKVPFGALK